MMLSIASKLFTNLLTSDDKKVARRNSLIKRTMGLADTGIPLGRENKPAGYIRWKAAVNEKSNNGKSINHDEEKTVPWREYVWKSPVSIGDCSWGEVRWRFYQNGLVCFDSEMSNASGKLDNGDIQGHRIEIREKNGLLVGVWIAGFFVRKDLPMRGFQASIIDEHLPLKFHFSELCEEQSGAWVCI